MSRAVSTYCGPAAVASLLGISRHEAATRLLEHEPRSRGLFHWPSLALVIGSARLGVTRYKRTDARPTLAQWLRDGDGREAIIFVSRHFVHVRHGKIVEHNGYPCRRGRVKVVMRIPAPPQTELAL